MSSRPLSFSRTPRAFPPQAHHMKAALVGVVAGMASFLTVLPATALAADTSPAPTLQQKGEASFACGGIGLDESTAYRAAMHQHPLSVMLTATDGSYLADVQIGIERANGNRKSVLATDAQGPICLIDLPKGRYTVKASSGAATQQRTVTVGGHPQTVYFRFGTSNN
jgi:hypothetical protein